MFGAPEPHPDHADRAVRAAFEMARAVEPDDEPGLAIGVGVNTGRVVAGSIGGAGRLNFSVIGDPVNVAARVEAATRELGEDVLITEATASELSARRSRSSRCGAHELQGDRRSRSSCSRRGSRPPARSPARSRSPAPATAARRHRARARRARAPEAGPLTPSE